MISVGPDTTRAAARATAANLSEQLAALEKMPTKELQAKFLELFGYPTRTANRPNLKKRLAWQLQARAEGGLSALARTRIEELAPLAPARWNRPPEKRGAPATAVATTAPRDPRLPPPGTVLEREHGGRVHRVTVRERDFEYEGASYKSLSAIARRVTNVAWNGYLFFSAALQKAASGGAEAFPVSRFPQPRGVGNGPSSTPS